MYSQGAMSRRRSVYSYGGASARNRHQGTSGQERVRLLQLMICLALFLAIFLWKGVFPQRLGQVRDNLLALITTDLDFREALASLSKYMAEGDAALSEFGAFCMELLDAGEQEEPVESVDFTPLPPADMRGEELRFLSLAMDAAACTAHYAALDQYGFAAVPLLEEPPQGEAGPLAGPVIPEDTPAVPAAGTVILASDHSGEEPPTNYTMDLLSLGELDTVTPVLGRLNSAYGYRDHPISGDYQFHGGVDIGGKTGDPIAAFAAGTVEYMGKNDSYGQYLQIDHGNGIKSFYAHCSRVLVSKGQMVAMGDTVAEIGSSGVSTGPHLHLELKYKEMHLNPAYYVDFVEK